MNIIEEIAVIPCKCGNDADLVQARFDDEHMISCVECGNGVREIGTSVNALILAWNMVYRDAA